MARDAVPRVLRRGRAAGRGRGWSIGSGCRRSKPRRCCRRCSSTARCSSETAGAPPGRVRRLAAGRRAARRRRAGDRLTRRGLRAPGAGERRGARTSLPLRSRPRPARRRCSRRACSTSCATSTGSATASGCCCRWPALLHDVGIYVSLRAHHKHSQYILAASQIFGLSNEETAIVSNIARYHRRGLPQDSHVPYIALDRTDRLIVNKLGGDAPPGQCPRRRAPAEGPRPPPGPARQRLGPGARRRRRPHHGAAGRDRARRPVRRGLRAAAGHSPASESSA